MSIHLVKAPEGEQDAIRAVTSGSAQHDRLRTLAAQETDMFDELARNHGIDAKSLEERLGTFTDNFKNKTSVLKRRLVSRTIGEYSNTRSIAMDMIEQSPTIISQAERTQLVDAMFKSIPESYLCG